MGKRWVAMPPGGMVVGGEELSEYATWGNMEGGKRWVSMLLWETWWVGRGWCG